jgi:hypothetical protein
MSYIGFSGHIAESPCLKLTVVFESIGELISFGCKFLLVLDDGLLKPLLVPDPGHPVLLWEIVAARSFSVANAGTRNGREKTLLFTYKWKGG